MHPPCSSFGTSIQARRRQTEMLRNLTVENAALLEIITRDMHKLPAEQDERVAEFVKDTSGRLQRIGEHVDLYDDEFVQQLDRLSTNL